MLSPVLSVLRGQHRRLLQQHVLSTSDGRFVSCATSLEHARQSGTLKCMAAYTGEADGRRRSEGGQVQWRHAAASDGGHCAHRRPQGGLHGRANHRCIPVCYGKGPCSPQTHLGGQQAMHTCHTMPCLCESQVMQLLVEEEALNVQTSQHCFELEEADLPESRLNDWVS